MIVFQKQYLSLLAVFLMVVAGYSQNKTLPIGFFSPHFSEGHTLYLYSEGSLAVKLPGQEKPIDSITLKKLGYNRVIDYAPKWFEPVYDKLDYGIFYIGVKKLGTDYVEIIANEATAKTVYMARHNGDFISWAEFLLTMHSVEFDKESQKVYDDPKIKSAGRIYDRNTFFRPLFVAGDWMEVAILENDFNPTGKTGWIRWRDGNRLLIRYNLLS
ncbi:hypothetical protein [Altibacter sp. HG106]|uniref:hypothetical protein n=1 Tax=Altibacter sp. HG106 TaxID=3023937 RepID=UPI002350C14B|nr:hypothetical protein [Altibacter sp. HG106]MDC7995470.1 hypothetical protein [Altibacter sp. HG106]